jgi:hypothetical protein
MGVHRGMGGNPRQYSLRELHRHLSLLRQQAPQISETIEWILLCILSLQRHFRVLTKFAHVE